jgi:hypothetical protein
MKQLHRILPLALAALSVCAYAQDSATLKPTYKVGDTSKFKLESTMTIEGAGDGTADGMITRKYTKVADNGDYTFEEKTVLKVVFGGQDIPVPDQTETQTYSSKGQLLDVQADAANGSAKESEFRMTALQGFHGPDAAVKVGDSWTYEQKADSNNGNVSAKVDYKVEAAEDMAGHKVFRIHGAAKEGGGDGTSDVTFWIDIASGSLLKESGTMKHVDVGAGTPVDMKFTITKQD